VRPQANFGNSVEELETAPKVDFMVYPACISPKNTAGNPVFLTATATATAGAHAREAARISDSLLNEKQLLLRGPRSRESGLTESGSEKREQELWQTERFNRIEIY
jgi:hypothetical protein